MMFHNVYNKKGDLHYVYHTPTPIHTPFTINPSIKAHTVRYSWTNPDALYSWKNQLTDTNSVQYYTSLSVHLTKAVKSDATNWGYCLTLYK